MYISKEFLPYKSYGVNPLDLTGFLTEVNVQLCYNCSPAVILTTGLRMKGGSPRIPVDTFGRPDAFC